MSGCPDIFEVFKQLKKSIEELEVSADKAEEMVRLYVSLGKTLIQLMTEGQMDGDDHAAHSFFYGIRSKVYSALLSLQRVEGKEELADELHSRYIKIEERVDEVAKTSANW